MENKTNQLVFKLILTRIIIVWQKISSKIKAKTSGSLPFVPMVAQRNWFLRPVAMCSFGA